MIDIGNRRQVFIDQRFLEQSTGLTLRVQQPARRGRVLFPERDTEARIGGFCSMLHDAGGYHLWYMARGRLDCDDQCRGIAYAHSDDGLHWEKPDLGLVAVDGDSVNNLVIGPGALDTTGGANHVATGFAVSLDPTAPPDERLRMSVHPKEIRKQAIQIFSSADGLRWRHTHEDVVVADPDSSPVQLDSNNPIFWDVRKGCYVAYMRRNLFRHGQDRSVAYAEAATLDGFPHLDDFETILAWEPGDRERNGKHLMDYYTSNAVPYAWADDAYFMFPNPYYHFYPLVQPEFHGREFMNVGVVDIQFGASRDGQHWERYDRQTWLGSVPGDPWQGRQLYTVYGLAPAPDGREIYIYYCGLEALHGWIAKKSVQRHLTEAGYPVRDPDCPESGVGLIAVRRDGFVALESAHEWGSFRSEPLRARGRELRLNLDTGATGELRVALLDGDGRELPGYGMDDCDHVFACNELDRAVRWGGRTEINLPDAPIRLQVEMAGTKLYAFQFAE